jgi:hypothetical protein
VVFSFLYWALRRLLQLFLLHFRSEQQVPLGSPRRLEERSSLLPCLPRCRRVRHQPPALPLPLNVSRRLVYRGPGDPEIRSSHEAPLPAPRREVELGRPWRRGSRPAPGPAGRRAAQRIAERLRGGGVAPALVLCSSSLRARQALAAVVPELESDAELRIEGANYGAGVDELLTRLRAVPESVPPVLLTAT